ncbi:hypothetical protein [Hymenobacter cellulosilyticus]|uniref:TonB-dependent receptor n=1 Tax=Hymenobacter cellulosilyticus TaxID=2932248 RepID=A0A8T9Q2U7_9BACT|nr:hypothetical protein [Hymenobacter cellulosilyticus]UOQ71355.1 hypothetical protein MUN79_22425 [Hymenobacter cellulosilyticus]
MRLFTRWQPNCRAAGLCLLVAFGAGSPHAWGQTTKPTNNPADTLRPVALGEVVVAASRVEESFLQSPVTVEKLTARALRLTPAPRFSTRWKE